jgi:Pilin (bacterial filament)
MSKSLVILVLVVIVLSWNFVFTDSKKIEYTDPAKILQNLSIAIKFKKAVYTYWKQEKVFPDAETWEESGNQINIDTSKSLVKGVKVGEDGPGVITVTFENKESIPLEKDIDGATILLIPEAKGEKLDWSCKGTMHQDYMPKSCQQIITTDDSKTND